MNGAGAEAAGVDGPDRLHKAVIDMFPDLDLTNIIIEYGHMTSEGLASFIIDKIEEIPKKRGMKRKASEAPETPGSVISDYSISADEEDPQGDLLVDKMLAELLRTIRSELRSGQQHNEMTTLKKFMCDQFPGVRCEFVGKILQVFSGKIVPTSIACFFSENNFGVKLQKVAPHLPQKFWCKAATPLFIRRNKKWYSYVDDNFHIEFKQYTELMTKHRQGEYAALITPDLKLSPQYNQIKWERTEPEECIDCLVCFDKFPVNRMIFCNAPTAPQESFFAEQSSLMADKPGSSKIQEEDPVATNENVINFGEDDSDSTHAFCRNCVRGQAQAATEQQPLADGGIGLNCMVPDCKNPILYSEIRIFLKREIRAKLDERILEENIGLASLQNLERCKQCNFAIEMEAEKHVDKVFDCLNCGEKHCRLCERKWDDDHIGISCEELDKKLKKDKHDRDLEKQLNEAVIRKCPRCGVAFMKDQGCNKMTCRCGMTQCYICRDSKIDYTHFCQHFRDPKVQNWKCDQCTKKCLLYEDANKKDEQMMDKIRKEAATNEGGVEAGPSTSSGAPAPAEPGVPGGPTLRSDLERQQSRARREGRPIPLPPPPPLVQNFHQGQAIPPPLELQPHFQHLLDQWRRADHQQPFPRFMQHRVDQAIPPPPQPYPPINHQQHQNQPGNWQHAGHQNQQANPQQNQFFQQPFVGYLFGGGPLGNNGMLMAAQPLPNANPIVPPLPPPAAPGPNPNNVNINHELELFAQHIGQVTNNLNQAENNDIELNQGAGGHGGQQQQQQ